MNENKCFNCGKTFTLTKDLTRHKARKTPCLIREVAPENVHNPNRCIYCNKILSTRTNLTKHLKTCKIKNGGLEILGDKIKFEQKIRILEEQAIQRDIQIAQKDVLAAQEKVLIAEQFKAMAQEIKELKKEKPQMVQNNIGQQINQQITINLPPLNNFDKPNLSGAHLTTEEAVLIADIFSYMYKRIWANPDYPENHSMFIPNKKDMIPCVYTESNWTYLITDIDQENFAGTVRSILDKLVNPHEPKWGMDALPGQNAMITGYRDRLRTNQQVTTLVLGKLLDNRDIVEKTKKDRLAMIPQ